MGIGAPEIAGTCGKVSFVKTLVLPGQLFDGPVRR